MKEGKQEKRVEGLREKGQYETLHKRYNSNRSNARISDIEDETVKGIESCCR